MKVDRKPDVSEAFDAQVKASLQRRWPLEKADEHRMAILLGQISAEQDAESRPAPVVRLLGGIVRNLAWAAAAVLLVAIVGWSIRTLTPQPAAILVTESPSTPQPAFSMMEITPTIAVQAKQAAPTPLPTDTLAAALLSSNVGPFPHLTFTFAADFPTPPAQITLYQQQLLPPLDLESAWQTAARLGVRGKIYSSVGEGWNQTVYDVVEGLRLVRFINSPESFVFYDAAQANVSGEAPPFSQQSAAAEAFLREGGFIADNYRLEATSRGQVGFVPLLDGYAVLYGNGDAGRSDWIDVSVNSAGKVYSVEYTGHHFEPAGQYAVLSPQQAWERTMSQSVVRYAQYAVLSPERPATYRRWSRPYATGQLIHLYDYAFVQASAENDEPLVQVGPFVATGNTQGIRMGSFLHAWGQLEPSESGSYVFEMLGWELSPLADEYLSGVIRKGGDTAQFVSEDGRNLVLPDAPADLEDGSQVNIRGVDFNGTLEWSTIDTGEIPSYYSSRTTCFGGGGGGGDGFPKADFGGGSLAALTIGSLPTPAPTLVPPFGVVGDAVEALTGTVGVTEHRYPDHTEWEVDFYVAPDSPGGGSWLFRLEGVEVSQVEPYQNLPVKIWGHIERIEAGVIYVKVDRLEEAYAGLRIQAWLGTQQIIFLEGNEVVLFTAQDGTQYVQDQTMGCGRNCLIGMEGSPILLEGYVPPDQSMGGYPVLVELMGTSAPPDDLASYVITSNQISVWDHAYDTPAFETSLEGHVTIQSIELAYLAISLEGCPLAGADASAVQADLYAQPIWVFSGDFEDGRRFIIQIQALPDEYLVPPTVGQ